MQGIENVSLVTAFTGGLLSFFSPCVLPLIPVYLSFVSGLSFEQMTSQQDRKKTFFKVFFNTLLFVSGFSSVFILLGLGASTIGKFLQTYQSQVSVVAGIVIVLLALHFMGILRIKWLYYEKRVQVKERRFGPLSSYLLGFAFAFGWTPCIGPILASILLLASQQDGTMAGVGLLAVYSAGLAIPFLATAIFLNTFLGFFKKVNRHFDTIEIAIGGVLLVAATWLIFNQLTHLFASFYPMVAVAGAMLLIVLFHRKLPKALFLASTGIVAASIVLGGGGLYLAYPSPTQQTAGGKVLVEFEDFSGNKKTLSEFEGKPVLLNFFASWCGPCKEEIPELIEIHLHKAQGRFTIVGINLDDDIEVGKKFVDSMSIPYPVLHGTIADLQALGERTALPKNIILDNQGRKILSYTGFPGEALLMKQLNNLNAEKVPAP